ncbi:MAG TPA: CoA transferase, partial [Tepidiformaceae bacterium]|nr:CoA transferase [Tepidiformaceae bacterium]
MPDARPPLDGLLVVDFSTTRAELAGRVLAELGAEVFKVEPPGGALARTMRPFDDSKAEDDPDRSLYWASVGGGKKSVVADLEDPAARESLRGLLSRADILIESFDPGEMARLGLSYPDVAAMNPGIIYCSVTPYGQDGPDALSPATDLSLEAAGGLLGLQGDPDRPPVPVGYPQASFHGGVQAAADAIIALNERERSGLGQHLDAGLQRVVGVGQDQRGLAPVEQPREHHLELLVDQGEGLHEAVAGGAVDLLDRRLEEVDGLLQILLLGMQEV